MGDYSSLLTASNEEMDAAKRLSDYVNNVCVFQPLDVVINSWIAVKLSDGSTDGVLYDTRREAVKHQQYEKQCMYLSLRQAPGGMEVQAAYALLKLHRDAYNHPTHQVNFIDPEHPTGGTDIRVPIALEDVRSQLRRMHMTRNKRRVR
jgi:hypothetical protein